MKRAYSVPFDSFGVVESLKLLHCSHKVSPPHQPSTMGSSRRWLCLWVFSIAWIRLSPLVYGEMSGNGNSIGAGGRDGNNNRYERGTGEDAATSAAETRNHHLIYGSPREDLEYVNDYNQLYDERAWQQVMKISEKEYCCH